MKKEFFMKTGIKIGIALQITMLFKLFFFPIDEFFQWDFIFIFLTVMLIGQGNIIIDQRLNKILPWINQPLKRLLIHLVISMVFTSLVLYISMLSIHRIKFGGEAWVNDKMAQTFLPALVLTFVLIILYICYQFFKALKVSSLEIERYKTETANTRLENLKNQINPHFLFNNLSVLSSLVYKNQDKAVDFINELAKVYRYVLDNKNAELVKLSDEIDFINHYIYLLRIRFDSAISFSIDIEAEMSQAFLPPMCLQMLVENTIQHNEASQANPLSVSIFTRDQSLVIENNKQKRTDISFSSQTGLKNIISRYAFFTNEKPEIINEVSRFTVILPLISQP